MPALLGKKVGMTQIFDEVGNIIPVTVVEAGPCVVLQVKAADGKDGYSAIQIGFMELTEKKAKKLSKPFAGHQEARQDSKSARYFKILKEFRVEDPGRYQVGQELTVDVFKDGDKIDVIGISKGKGFAGVIKRWRFKGAKATHGASKVHRKPQSAGATDAARTFKGKKSPGHLGAARITIQNLRIVGREPERGALLIRGAVPGPNGSIVEIRNAVKVKANKAAK